MNRNETEIEEIREKMLQPKYYSSASAYKELEQRVEELEEANMEIMEEWDALSEELKDQDNGQA